MESGVGTRYCEIAYGNVRNRNIIIPSRDLGIYIASARPVDELYRSLYDYDEEINEHLKVKKTVSTYRGKYYLEKILFDFDKRDDTHEFLADRVFQFCHHLMDEWHIPPEAIAVYFSGTGFHVTIPDIFHFIPANNLPNAVSATLMKHFSQWKIDDIYSNATRIVRVNNTINLKSQLYKVRIDVNDLIHKTGDEITLAARERRHWTPAAASSGSTPAALPDYTSQQVPARSYMRTGGLTVEAPMVIDSTQYVTCMQKLYAQGEMKGERHNSILRLASAFRRGGVPHAGCEVLMLDWCKTLEPYEVKAIVKDVYSRDFKYSCKDPIMNKHCDPQCMFYMRKNYTLETLNAHQVEQSYTEFMQSDYSKSTFDLAHHYVMPKEYAAYPGEVIVVFGDTGVGKSTFVQNICTKLKHLKVLYLPLEMDTHLTFRRFIQIEHNLDKRTVNEHYTAGNNSLSAGIQHIKIASTAPRIEEIHKLIADSECKVVVIDTIDCIPAYGNDENDRVGQIVIALKAIAQRLRVIIIGIHHISKFAALNSDSLNVHSGKGSSSVEQKADKVIAVERVGDLGRRVHALKSRDEDSFDLLFRFNVNTFRFEQVEEIGAILHGEHNTD